MNTSTGSSVEDQVLNLSRTAPPSSERHLDDEYSSGLDDEDDDNDLISVKQRIRHHFD